MQQRHFDKKRYFEEQAYTTKKYVIPFIRKNKEINENARVLEIGCGEAGNLKPFLDIGCTCVGIDYNEVRIKNGQSFYSEHPQKTKLNLISSDIYQLKENIGKFDVIIIRDVIEHIHNQQVFLKMIHGFMNPQAVVFIAFPPWQNPFGGHQQICDSVILSHLPYFHLLPKFLYKKILEIGGETKGKINDLLEIKETGISIERFKKQIKKNQYKVIEFSYYLINPNYEIKFGLKPRKLHVIKHVPYLRNYVTTCIYCLLSNCP